MYNSFNVIFNSISSDELDINVIARPQIPSPQPRIKPIDIPGAQGKQYEIDGYEDIEIQVEFNFISQEDLHEKFRKCKRWINNIEDNKLIFSDNKGIFYRVNFATITSSERIVNIIGKFTVIFNCEPFSYAIEGQHEITVNNEAIIYNDGDLESKPIIKIKGEGLVTIVINGETIKANIGQNIIIDSYLDLSYKEDKTPQNNNLKCKKYPQLKIGENTVSYSGGRVDSFSIIPNWIIY